MSRVVIAETMRRHVDVVVLVYFGLLAMLAFFIPRADNPGASWIPLLGLLTIISTAQLIGPEFSTGTLQLILAKPINRTSYLLSRVAGVTLAISVAIWSLLAIEAVGMLVERLDVPWSRLLAKAVNQSLDTLLIAAVMALLGSLLRAYFNVAVYFAVSIALAAAPAALQVFRRFDKGLLGVISRFLGDHPEIDRAIAWVDRNAFPDPPFGFSREWALMILSNAAVALFLAAVFFRRREVPYGGD